MIKNFKEKLKRHFHEVIKTKKSSHSIASGFAIGTFISILPTPGLNILLGLLVILIFEKVNKYSLVASLFFWNPLILWPMNILSFRIGYLIFGDLLVVKYNVELLNQIYNFSRIYLIGSFMMAVIVSLASYFIIRTIIDLYRKRRGS